MPAKYKVGIYARLSKDDERSGESLSIENQKSMLVKYVSEQTDWILHEIYVDDGWSGSNFARPSFQRMLDDAKNGTINLIIVKDLSRFGRNYIEVGRYAEYIFPAIGCRFVALNDDIDTVYNDNDLMPFRNLMNEQLSKDTSRKVKAVKKANARVGRFMGAYAPYGYKKDVEAKHRLVVDEKTAPIVRRIFEMRRDGMGYVAIASALNDEQIPSPRRAWYEYAKQTAATIVAGLWSGSVVMRLLCNEVYLGHMVQGKQGKLSFRDRSIKSKPKDEWIKVENTHEPIIGRELWDQVQDLQKKKHRPRKLVHGDSNIFVGLIKCADCGYSMRYQRRKYIQANGEEKISGSFICGYYSRSGKSACSVHTIHENVLYNLVLSDIQANAGLIAEAGEKPMTESLVSIKNIETSENLASYKDELKAINERIKKLNDMMQEVYEDKVNGIIDNTILGILLNNFQTEKDEKIQEVTSLSKRIHAIDCSRSEITAWVHLIKKYSNIRQLNRAILLDIFDHIDIEESAGKRDQCKVKIYYRHVGFVDTVALNEKFQNIRNGS